MSRGEEMLKNSNDQDLRNHKINDELIPFVQVWQEMLHAYTLDVYQYRILNSLTALIELDLVIQKTIDGLYTTNHNIDCCRLEALQIINKDEILEKHEKELLNRLRTHLGKKADKQHEQKTLGYQVKYVMNKLKLNYLNNLFEELYISILNQNNELIIEYSNSIISQSISNGWSARALFELIRHFKNDESLEQKWRKFKSELDSHIDVKHDTLIQVPLIYNNSKDKLESIGITIKTYAELVEEYFDFDDMKTILKNGKTYIQLQVDATDVYSAAHIAIKSMSELMNFASFYNLIGTWDIKSLLVISINTVTKYHKPIKSDELYQTYDYLDSSGNIFESTRNIFKAENKKNIQTKLQGAFAYTNISRSSLFQEEKYMNLWVAIESLARTDMYVDIISNVKEILPAALCLRYIYRIVRNFVEDCGRCGIRYDFSDRCIDLRQESKRRLVKETIEVFQDEILYLELLKKCDINTMLHYRCGQVKRLICDLQYALKKIENHYDKVKWQVQRLYRIRNEIAHSALQEQTSLIIYIEHMYDYLSIFILEIVTCIENKKLESLGEVYTVIKDNYELFIDFSKSKVAIEQDVVKNSVLKTGIIDLLFNC